MLWLYSCAHAHAHNHCNIEHAAVGAILLTTVPIVSLPVVVPQVPNLCGLNCSHPVSQQRKRHVGGVATAAELSFLLRKAEDFRRANAALKSTLGELPQPGPEAGVSTRPNLDNPDHDPAVLDRKQAAAAFRGGAHGARS